MQEKAKHLAAAGIRQAIDVNVATSAMYIVWFSKTLQNWKALVSTDVVNGIYVEVTHNGTKGETYVDVYEKKRNICFAD